MGPGTMPNTSRAWLPKWHRRSFPPSPSAARRNPRFTRSKTRTDVRSSRPRLIVHGCMFCCCSAAEPQGREGLKARRVALSSDVMTRKAVEGQRPDGDTRSSGSPVGLGPLRKELPLVPAAVYWSPVRSLVRHARHRHVFGPINHGGETCEAVGCTVSQVVGSIGHHQLRLIGKAPPNHRDCAHSALLHTIGPPPVLYWGQPNPQSSTAVNTLKL